MDETETLYSGIAVGGPLEGQTIEGRFPSGIVFVSKPQNKAWVYDYYSDQSKFYARPNGYDAVWDNLNEYQKLAVVSELVGMDTTREFSAAKILVAAEGSTYEVRALPEDGGK
jgi:hypothetical protein